jgi:hypothetical protein
MLSLCIVTNLVFSELLPQADVTVATEQRRQNGEEDQMAPGLFAMLAVYVGHLCLGEFITLT